MIDRQQHPSEFLWRQYNMYIDLYKFYLSAVLKVEAFYFAITGGILSFVLTRPSIAIASISLYVPAIFGIGLAIVFITNQKNLTYLQEDINNIQNYFQFNSAPEVKPLKSLLVIFSIIHLITSISIVLLAIYYEELARLPAPPG